MKPKPTQEELQAATHATLRAHATSEEAKTLVGKLFAMVDEDNLATGLRKNKRKTTAGKLEYATGAFLAGLLLPHSSEEPHEWVYCSLHAHRFTGRPVSLSTFTQLVEGQRFMFMTDWEHLLTSRFAHIYLSTPSAQPGHNVAGY